MEYLISNTFIQPCSPHLLCHYTVIMSAMWVSNSSAVITFKLLLHNLDFTTQLTVCGILHLSMNCKYRASEINWQTYENSYYVLNTKSFDTLPVFISFISSAGIRTDINPDPAETQRTTPTGSSLIFCDHIILVFQWTTRFVDLVSGSILPDYFWTPGAGFRVSESKGD